jgi:hypothetical protein
LSPYFLPAGAKFNQAKKSGGQAGQRISKKNALIALDSHGRIEPFQGVAATPAGFCFFLGAVGEAPRPHWRTHSSSLTIFGSVITYCLARHSDFGKEMLRKAERQVST